MVGPNLIQPEWATLFMAPDLVMPRIRTLKPEHRQHRKIGLLSDREYRLWVGMLCEADDHGRLVSDLDQLRVTIFGYQRRLSTAQVGQALESLCHAGLIACYETDGVSYAYFPSWKDHQKVDHPTDSRYPDPPPREPSRALASVRGGSDRIGSEGSDQGSSCPARPPDAVAWGPRELIQLYNAEAPDESPAVQTVSPERLRKAKQYLDRFPERAWWQQVFAQMHHSAFLRGLAAKTNGHESFVADFDWLLTKGKDGSENAAKVHDGRYQDKGR